MKWFLNLATGAKLFVSFGLMIVLLAVAILAAYRGINGIRQSQQEDRKSVV